MLHHHLYIAINIHKILFNVVQFIREQPYKECIKCIYTLSVTLAKILNNAKEYIPSTETL